MKFRILILVAALFSSNKNVLAQYKRKIDKAFEESAYNFVDTIFFKAKKGDYIIIGNFKKGKKNINGKSETEEHLLIYK